MSTGGWGHRGWVCSRGTARRTSPVVPPRVGAAGRSHGRATHVEAAAGPPRPLLGHASSRAPPPPGVATPAGLPWPRLPPRVVRGQGRNRAAGERPPHTPPPGSGTAAWGHGPVRHGPGWVQPCGGTAVPPVALGAAALRHECPRAVPSRGSCPRVAVSPAQPCSARALAAAPGAAPSLRCPRAQPCPTVPARPTLRGTATLLPAPLGCCACPQAVPSCATRVPKQCSVLPDAVSFLPAVPSSAHPTADAPRFPGGACSAQPASVTVTLATTPPTFHPARVCLSFQPNSSPAPSPGVDSAHSSPAGPVAGGH